MANVYDVQNIKIRAIGKDVIICDMSFDELKTTSGIIIRSDDGKSHGVKPRWGQVYKVGPDQKEVRPGQWILVEHGRWTRKVKINDGESVKSIQKIDTEAILAVSDDTPTSADVLIKDSDY